MEQWRVRPLERDDWPLVEALFGERGACGGCWCMYWRLPRGGKLWEEMKGEKNRQAFRELVESGAARGCLTFDGDAPAGWCCAGPREDFPRLNKSRWITTDWPQGMWSVVCFYIPARYRRCGVATALLAGTVDLARADGASALEAYPAPDSWGKKTGSIPAAFAYTGTERLFRAAGFKEITGAGASRSILRLALT